MTKQPTPEQARAWFATHAHADHKNCLCSACVAKRDVARGLRAESCWVNMYLEHNEE